MPQRSERDKTRLKSKAKKLIDNEETTGANDFKYRAYPEVVAVVIDLGSDRGFVQISGQEEDSSRRISTGGQQQKYILEWLEDGQTCMLYGRPSVMFIVPAPLPDSVPD
ncbi:hypothetical protein F53441_5601 [Fusarium austroafricanum]|uniref:Uncharacterized protein n=1 Tax=Fusarium austroafricanum TaxID=2364996 RepID=A0A8H4KKK6_9HYPO|nr:hypothetical protein F53441_5601 [Fusarium austroafricanum]